MYRHFTKLSLAGLSLLLGFAIAAGNHALAQGSWESSVFGDVAPMPTARIGHHVVAIGGLLYVAGGNDGGGKNDLEAYHYFGRFIEWVCGG